MRDERRKEADIARKKIKIEKEDPKIAPDVVNVKEEKVDPVPSAPPVKKPAPKTALKADGPLSSIEGLSAADIILGPRKVEPKKKKEEEKEEPFVPVQIKQEKIEEKANKKADTTSKTCKSSQKQGTKPVIPKTCEETPDVDEEDEALPDNVKSFLDEMNQLDKINKIRVKSNLKKPLEQKKVKRDDKVRDQKSISSSSSKNSSKDSKGHRTKSSTSESKKSSSSASHRSSSSRRDSEENSKSCGAKKHADLSRHKSSSSSSTSSSSRTERRKSIGHDDVKKEGISKSPRKNIFARGEEKGKVEIKREKVEDASDPKSKRQASTSPIPDFTAELDMLPDDFEDHFLPDTSDDPPAMVDDDDDDGDVFDEEDENEAELKRIFDAYQPERAKPDEAAIKKAKRLEEAKKASGSSSSQTSAEAALAAAASK